MYFKITAAPQHNKTNKRKMIKVASHLGQMQLKIKAMCISADK